MSEGVQKWMPWLLVGGLGVIAYVVYSGSSSSGGLATITQSAPDTSATDQARFGFLGTAIGGLLDLQKEDLLTKAQIEGQTLADQFQLSAIKETVAGQVAAAQAQADADKVAARAAARGHRGLDLGFKGFGIHIGF